MNYYDATQRDCTLDNLPPTSDTSYFIISNGEVLSTMCGTLSLNKNSFSTIDPQSSLQAATHSL